MAGFLAWGALACGGEGNDDPDLPPDMELGYLRDGAYQRLGDDGTAWVIDAPQGGYWTMPAVRMQGLTDQAFVTCSLTDDELGVLGEQTTERLFEEVDGMNGTYQVDQFLVPLLEVDDPLFLELPGHTGDLACSIADGDGVTLDVAHAIVMDTEVAM